MKKFVAMFAMVAFFAAITAPVSAMNEEKPKKAATEQKAEKKKECATPCTTAEKSACGEKEKK
jgi:hypothetical protein